MIVIRELNRIKIKVARGARRSSPSRSQDFDEAASAIRTSQNCTAVADDANLVLSYTDIVERGINSLVHLLKSLSVVVRSGDQTMCAYNPDIITIVVDRAYAGICRAGLDRLQLRPTLLCKHYGAE